MSRHTRRAFLRSLAATSAASLSASFSVQSTAQAQAYVKPDHRWQAVRKNAAQLNRHEIEMFKRGFDLLVKQRVMDELIQAHGDMSQQQHELAPNVSLLTFHLMPYPGGARFLAWHRAFLLEFETALRRAVVEEYGAGSLNQVFVPYWDATQTNGLPDWVKDYQPAGMQARSVEGLPSGHPGYGVPSYEVQIARYPGTYAVARNLPAAKHVHALLNLSDFTAFSRRLEWAPAITRRASTDELARLRWLASRLHDPAVNYEVLAEGLAAGQLTREQESAVFMALTRLGSAVMDSRYLPDVSGAALRELLNYAGQFYSLGPHTGIHTWVAGHDKLIKGTALYFHEMAADPVFWMLHAEVDRIWQTWQTRWPGRPNLQGADAEFKPWRKGRTWTLNQLLDSRALPYRYDQLYEPELA